MQTAISVSPLNTLSADEYVHFSEQSTVFSYSDGKSTASFRYWIHSSLRHICICFCVLMEKF